MKRNNLYENDHVGYEIQEKKKFEGITKLKNNYRRFSNFAQEENNINNSKAVNTSYHYKNNSNNEKVNKTHYENSNIKDRSYSPITHKRNRYVDEYVNVKNSGTDFKEENKNSSYFQEFNVIKSII